MRMRIFIIESPDEDVSRALTLGGDPFSSTGGGRELVLVLAAGGSTL